MSANADCQDRRDARQVGHQRPALPVRFCGKQGLATRTIGKAILVVNQYYIMCSGEGLLPAMQPCGILPRASSSRVVKTQTRPSRCRCYRQLFARPIKRAGPAPVGPQSMSHIQASYESTSFTVIGRSCRSRRCREKSWQARGQTRGVDLQRQLPRPRHARAAARFPIRPCFARTQMALSPYKASKDRSRSAWLPLACARLMYVPAASDAGLGPHGCRQNGQGHSCSGTFRRSLHCSMHSACALLPHDAQCVICDSRGRMEWDDRY